MLKDSYSATVRPDTVTISVEEYADLIRASAQLDAILAMGGYPPDTLCRAIARERNIEMTEG